MRMSPRASGAAFFLGLAALPALVGCGETATAPAPAAPVRLAGTAGRACPAPAGTVVSTEAELLAAVAGAVPGDVIAIDGRIVVERASVRLETDGVRLTCATQGSGIVFRNERRLDTFGNGIMVDHLWFDATDGGPLPIILFGSDALPCCANVRFSDNVVVGFRLTGIFALRSMTGLAITANTFEASPTTLSAIQIQGGPSDGTVARNTVVVPSGAFAGISVVAADDMTVEGNVVIGAAFAAMRLGTLRSVWQANRVEGATGFGILFESPDRRDNVIRNNHIAGAGTAGILVREACHNLFLGNTLHGNGDDLGTVFERSTGSNLFVGAGKLVADDGAADCDGDGTPDPNVVTGQGPIRRGLRLPAFSTPLLSVLVDGKPVVLR